MPIIEMCEGCVGGPLYALRNTYPNIVRRGSHRGPGRPIFRSIHLNLSTRDSLKVFLVENSIPVRRQLEALIGRINGVQIVGEAEDADAAVSGIAASGADVAVVDFRLAQASGMDVLAALAGSRRCVIAIVLTNHATATVREVCRHAGADYFFDKTSEFGRALDAIRAIASNRRVGAS